MKQSRFLDKINTDKKVVALTFDDGPDCENFLEILNILGENEIKCTFFLTGTVVETFPDYSNMILQKGHEIGNHSYSHAKFDQLGKDSIRAEIIKTEKAMINILGVDPRPLFKSPFNIYNNNILDMVGRLGYTYAVSASIITADCFGVSAEVTAKNIINNVQPGTVLLMHIRRSNNTIEALPLIIKGLSDIGYTFVTISELIALEQKYLRPKIINGSSGEAVRELQKFLNELGYDLGPIDGSFGPLTEIAVRTFQFDQGLEADGIVEDNTWAAIERKLKSLQEVAHNSHKSLLLKKDSKVKCKNNIKKKRIVHKILSFFTFESKK
jgi:peptidoglycan-N-acetylglucosamine deacetylase